MARQHWKSSDAGLAGLRDSCIACGDTLLIHEHACGDQHEVPPPSIALLPGLRLDVIRDGECRLRDMRKQFGLGAELFAQPDGSRLLRYDPRWQDRRAQRLRDQLRTEGYFDTMRQALIAP